MPRWRSRSARGRSGQWRCLPRSMSDNITPKATFSFVSLGCPKNLVDSERMLGLLAQDGYRLVPDAEKADLVIVNTCGFIDAAREEALGAVRGMVGREKGGGGKGGGVAGCPAGGQRGGGPG